MATLVSSALQSIKGFQTITGRETVAMYFVEMSGASDDGEVITYCTDANVVDGLSGVQHRVQRLNETYNLSAITGLSDERIFVFRVEAEQLSPENFRKWKVRVTYRNPTFQASGGSNPGNPDRNLPPQDRASEFWTDVKNIIVPRAFGTNDKAIRWPWNTSGDITQEPEVREQGTFGPISNAAGHRYGEIDTLTLSLPVFVYKTNVPSPFQWIPIQDEFFGTTNSDEWDVFGEHPNNVSEGTCMFLNARTGRPLYWNNIRYYEMEVRVLYNKNKHKILVRNEGDKYWAQRDSPAPDIGVGAGIAGKEWVLEIPFAGGMAAQPPIPLNLDGTLKTASDRNSEIIEFTDLNAAEYKGLNGAVAGSNAQASGA